MTIPAGFRQMGVEMMVEVAAEEEQANAARQREQQAKANAYAHVCHSLGMKNPKGLTGSQKAMADAIARTWAVGQSPRRGFGFSIPTEGRKPQR